MELTYRRPDESAKLTEDERAQKVQETADLCVIGGKRFFVRGVVPLRVVEREKPYNIGVWVELSQADFETIYRLWDEPDQSAHSLIESTLANDIHGLPSTLGLKAKLRLTGPTTRPEVDVATMAHPLSQEQQQGITEHRAHEYSQHFA